MTTYLPLSNTKIGAGLEPGGDAEFDNLVVNNNAEVGGNLEVIGEINSDASYLLDGQTLIDKPNATSLRVGPLDTVHVMTGTNNTIVNQGGHNITSGESNVAIARAALNSNQTGSHCTAVGYNSLSTAITDFNTALGDGTGANLTTGKEGTFLGARARTSLATADNQIAIGFDAVCSSANTCQIGNVSVRTLKLGSGMIISDPGVGGSFSLNNSNQNHNGTGGSMICIGTNTNTSLTTGNQSLHLGSNSGANATSGSSNVLIGSPAGNALTSETGNVCIGATSNITAGITNATSLGFGAIATVSNSCQIGNASVKRLTIGGSTTSFDIYRPNSTSLSIGAFPTGTFTGTENVIIQGTASKLTTGGLNTFIASNSGAQALTTTGNCAIGRFSLSNITNTTLALPGGVSLGEDANVALGLNALSSLVYGWYNVGVGASSLPGLVGTALDTDKSRNVGIGRAAGLSHNGKLCTFIGHQSGANVASSYENSVAIGQSALITASSQIMLGNSSVNALLPGGDNVMKIGSASRRYNEIFCTNATINTSDRNMKDLIAPATLGLEFINNLKPVKYKWKDYIQEYEENEVVGSADNLTVKKVKKSREFTYKRLHYGLIAQEVKETMNKLGVSDNDFAGYIDTKEVGLGLRYIEFIAPMIKAIQELSARVVELENKN